MMAIRDLPTTDGLPACEVETAEELTQVLIPAARVQHGARRAALRDPRGIALIGLDGDPLVGNLERLRTSAR